MGSNKFLVTQLQPRRSPPLPQLSVPVGGKSTDHANFLRYRTRRPVRLASPPCTSASLSVVRRCWRHIPQMDNVQLTYVDSKLHRRRAEDCSKLPFAEVFFTLFAQFSRDLACMGTALDSTQQPGSFSIYSSAKNLLASRSICSSCGDLIQRLRTRSGFAGVPSPSFQMKLPAGS